MLTIQTFGGLIITLDSERVTGFASRKAEALFVYLACHSAEIPREVAATLLWDAPQARALANLSVMLTSLRKQLGDYLQTTRHTVGFNHELSYALDVESFVAATGVHGKLTRSMAAQLALAVDLYCGDFLAGFGVRHAPEFEGWVLLEQERLRRRLFSALERLTAYFVERDQLQRAIPYARQLVQHDPLNEEAQRQLIELLWWDGQQVAATAQYEACREVLWEELGVEPEQETAALLEQLQQAGRPDRNSAEITTNIQPAVTRFFGRSTELAKLTAQINTPTNRLITVVGQGGVGKSRLAIEIARHFAPDFRDGTHFVSLAAVSDKNGLLAAIADTIGFTFSGTNDPADQLMRYLQNMEMLLILDNFEQLVATDCVAFVIDLVGISAELKLLVTSRERLNLQAESLLTLGGLPFKQQPDAENGEPLAAVQLIVDRVTRLKADAQIEQAVALQLCELVQGLPLALELAASWIRVLPLAEIVNEVARGVDLLETTARDVPERHRSLRAVFEQSWQMLTQRERDLYARLSVFRGGFGREAAQEVAGASLPLLAGLVDKSLLRRDETGRYWRHPLLVQFAAEKLGELAALSTVQRKHAVYFARWSQSADRSELLAEHENLRRAWQWSVANEPPVLTQLIDPMTDFYQTRTRFREALRFFEQTLDGIDRSQFPILTARLQISLAIFTYRSGFYPRSRTIIEAALATVEKTADTPLIIDALQVMSDILHLQGEIALAQTYLQRIVAASRKIGDEERIMNALNGLGNNCHSLGEYQAALAYFAEGLVIAGRRQDQRRIAIFHSNRGIVFNHMGQPDAALADYRAARALFNEIGHELGEVNTIHNIGMIYRQLERYADADAMMQEALKRHRALQNRAGESGALSVLGTIHRVQGDIQRARTYLHAALRLQLDIDARSLVMASLSEYALLEFAQGNVGRAVLLQKFVCQHPSTMAVTRTAAETLLAEWRDELPAQLFSEGSRVENSAEMTLESIIALVVTDLQ
jgi:predicted ATPase/DNA-binding SARP family transcriptional activator